MYQMYNQSMISPSCLYSLKFNVIDERIELTGDCVNQLGVDIDLSNLHGKYATNKTTNEANE